MKTRKVDLTKDGCWVEVAPGRKRWFPKNHNVTKAVRAGLKLDLSPKSLDYTKRVVYRDENGKLGIPMTPDMIPEGCTPITITSLAQEDAICKEMRQELEKQYANDAEVTAYLDQAQADATGLTPRQRLNRSDAYKTDFGREIVHNMLVALDHEERQREKVDVNFFFHTREYDR